MGRNSTHYLPLAFTASATIDCSSAAAIPPAPGCSTMAATVRTSTTAAAPTPSSRGATSWAAVALSKASQDAAVAPCNDAACDGGSQGMHTKGTPALNAACECVTEQPLTVAATASCRSKGHDGKGSQYSTPLLVMPPCTPSTNARAPAPLHALICTQQARVGVWQDRQGSQVDCVHTSASTMGAVLASGRSKLMTTTGAASGSSKNSRTVAGSDCGCSGNKGPT